MCIYSFSETPPDHTITSLLHIFQDMNWTDLFIGLYDSGQDENHNFLQQVLFFKLMWLVNIFREHKFMSIKTPCGSHKSFIFFYFEQVHNLSYLTWQ